MINLIRQYMETLKGGLHEPAVDAELEKIYREVGARILNTDWPRSTSSCEME